MKVKLLFLFLSFTLLLSLTSCGRGKSGKSTAPDPCTLLTRADAEKILGKTVKDPDHPVTGSQNFEVNSCAYHAQDGMATDAATLITMAPASGGAVFAKTSFENDKKLTQSNYSADPVDVPDLADEAYWVGGSGNVLYMLKGDLQVTLMVGGQQGSTPPSALVDLGKLVISRLP